MHPALVNRIWLLANSAAARRYRSALANPRAAQLAKLDRYLTENADTAFGEAHDFARLRTAADYQAAVSVAPYDAFAPYVDRIRAGEPNVLTRAPVRRLIPSSGSTAARKLIPYTDSLQREFNAAIAPWMTDLFRHDSRLMRGPAYWSVSPAAQQGDDSPSAVPIGFDDDAAYLGGFLQRVVGVAFAVPASVRLIQDMDRFRYVTLRHLLAARDLRLISVWHPSFLTLLLGELPKHWPVILKDVTPARSRELERLDPSQPAAIWPRLGLISCWADAHAAMSVPDLARRFPGVRIQPKGLIATEAFVTLPYGESSHPLALNSHFFEFVGDDGRAYLADELERGGEYAVVVTTGGGLYRYRMGDRVRVDGFVGNSTPSLRFLGRDDLVSDRFGEKLSDGFVGCVLRALFDTAGIAPAFAMLAPCVEPPATRYVLYVELTAISSPDLADRLDGALRANPHYAYCRDLGQLGAPAVRRLAANAYARYVERCRAEGRRLGDIKAAPLSAWDGWDHVFTLT